MIMLANGLPRQKLPPGRPFIFHITANPPEQVIKSGVKSPRLTIIVWIVHDENYESKKEYSPEAFSVDP